MKTMTKRWASGLAVSALVASGFTLSGAPAGAAEPAATCTVSSTAHIFSFNDFHGRILEADQFFTTVTDARAELGAENVGLVSVGDNIGGSIFESFINDDAPVLDIMNTVGVDAAAVGNHEFDKGWDDLSGRVVPETDFPWLGANVYAKGTERVAGPLRGSTIINIAGHRIGVIGAVTDTTRGLVSPDGVENLDFGNVIEAVNREADYLSNQQVDSIVAAIHDGSPTPDLETGRKNAADFEAMMTGLSDDIDVVLNGHTHQGYNGKTDKGQLIVQARSYAELMNDTSIGFSDSGEVCSLSNEQVTQPDQADLSNPAISEVRDIIDAAVANAEEQGEVVVGEASEAISTPDFESGVRDIENPINNMVAQMFSDVLSTEDIDVIGLQNPGGTRSSFDQGDITYKEAAGVLPFANTLMTAEITGAQFKTILEQQWQRDDTGEIPSRPFLRLGVSDQVRYTYDESREEGDRITGIWIDGAPIDPAATYTVGSGSFLINGGDNFREFTNATNVRDTGRIDLEAWVDWVQSADGALEPDYTKRGTSVTTEVTDSQLTFTLGEGLADGVSSDTLDMSFVDGAANVTPTVNNTSIEVYNGDTKVGEATITDGVATVSVERPLPAGTTSLLFLAQPTGYTTYVAVDPAWTDGSTEEPVTSISTNTADFGLVGNTHNVWGTVRGGKPGGRVLTQAWVGGRWSNSQERAIKDNGGYVIPMTYGMNSAGTQTFRVVAEAADGSWIVSEPFNFTREPYMSVNHVASKPVGQPTFVWGTVHGLTGGERIVVQGLVNGQWSNSQQGTVKPGGGYVLPLTYGINSTGKTTYRVVAVKSGGGYVISQTFSVNRTR